MQDANESPAQLLGQAALAGFLPTVEGEHLVLGAASDLFTHLFVVSSPTVFLASLIGIPPLGGWWAKFGVFAALVDAGSGLGWALAIIMAVNTAIAAYYYLKVARAMWFDDVPEVDTSPVSTPTPLTFAVGVTLIATLVFGIVPQVLNDVTTFTPVAFGG